ncbi:MAG: hypothetical protein PVH19_05975 [Planctomycetia bacterium]|jgi:hypothetical protein
MFSGIVCAEEQWQSFLDALRTSGYHDMAEYYLDRMAARRDCPKKLKEVVDYERGITLLSQPAGSRTEREEKLKEAGKLFDKFVEKHPKHEYVTKARTQLANVLVEQGRMFISESEEPGVSARTKSSLQSKARRYYNDAKKVFGEQDEKLTAKLKKLPEPKTAEETRQRDVLRADFLQTRLSLATTDYEIGMTYPKARDRDKYLRGAAKKYHELYDKYGSFLAGLYARMWEGRCYQKLSDDKRAAEIFESVLMQVGDSNVFRALKNKTYVLLIETMIDPKVKRYADALGFYQEWEKSRLPNEISSPEGLEIRYLAGVASLELARSLKKNNKNRPKLLADARTSFRFVMRFPGEIRSRAREKMADKLLASGEGKKPEPRDFKEAMEYGRAALDKIQIIELRQKSRKQRLSAREAQRQIDEAEQEAIDYFQKSLELAKRDTTIEEINQARYYLAYLSLKRGELYNAAVFGDYLARRFPSGAIGRPAAKIALAAFVEMSTDPNITPEAKNFADRRSEEMARYVIEVWPTSAEANDARKIFIHAALRQKNTKQAIEMVEAIPPNAEGRGPLQMIIGRVLYSEYVELLAKKKEAAESSSEVNSPELDRLLSQAKKFLESGLRLSVKEGKIDRSFFAGELTLARIYLNEGEDKKAADLVLKPRTGLLAIADRGKRDVVKDGLDVEAYKTSLRVLVAVQKLSEAKKVMESLESKVKKADKGGTGKQLTQIYVSLAQELKQTLDVLQKTGKKRKAAQVRASFEDFLDQVSKNAESVDFNIMQWVATTYEGLADSFEKEGDTLSPEAKQYYEKSIQIYKEILERYKKDPKFAPSESVVDAIRVHLAGCLKKLGQYGGSLTQLFEVLKRRETMVDAQVEAASTYQAWAGTQGNAKYYVNAMLGGGTHTTPSGEKVYLFWGWGKLSKKLAKSEKHRELFHETRYRLDECRYKYAISGQCKNPKKYLQDALRDIQLLSKLYPKMGGEKMEAKYRVLFEKIQQALKR